jgi:hypothetical protein
MSILELYEEVCNIFVKQYSILKAVNIFLFLDLKVSVVDKAVNREDKRSRRYRDRDFAKIERSRRYRDR